ncbi:FixH family protein [Leptospira wolffii]|uniref:FixH family protein n=1 Tax=Leptospira wolffii TaxID=409998 RepID=A0A2M9Z8K6_9LEPT|nr:FixH family protein [Leptospira wolffii]EPG66607.1 FixH family protein [Leptospira wolffii serovar Khorat str. Khorat-H2]PJZ64672.1 nitrogen fixation protein FixH [Leptospira wolffii]TGL55441.1 nitrogen fixation protein FixH [Leptospira wolffii]
MHKSLKRAFFVVGASFLGMFVATFFTVKIALAGHTPPVDANYYEKGLKYDQTVFAQREMSANGYDLEADWFQKQSGLHPGKQKLQVKFVKNSKSVSGAKLEIRLERSATDAFNKKIELKETSSGIYEGETEVPFSGSWRAVISAKLGDQIMEKTRQIEVLK